MTEPSFWNLVRADIEATTHANYRLHHSPAWFWTRATVKLVVSPAVRVVLLYRIAHLLTSRRLMPFAMILRQWGIRISGAELNPLATVGPGLYLPHSIGAGFGAYVTIGRNCTLQAGASIGPQPFGDDPAPKMTILGDNVYVGLHAVVLGGVAVGDGAIIGANAVVMRDVAPYSIVSASPARVVGVRSPESLSPPSKAMPSA